MIPIPIFFNRIHHVLNQNLPKLPEVSYKDDDDARL